MNSGPAIKLEKNSQRIGQPSSLSMSFHRLRPGNSLTSSILLVTVILVGWQIRDEYLIRADRGLGYLLGLTGGVMMLLLLIYPLRKRFGKTKLFIFSTPTWFRIHMFFGIVGPLLILYHCNFSLGSLNSNIALCSMLLMVSSGLYGRFLYSRIHMGIYGKKAELSELLTQSIETQKALGCMLGGAVHGSLKELPATIKSFESRALSASRHHSSLGIFILAAQSRIACHRLINKLRNHQPEEADHIRFDKELSKHQLRLIEHHVKLAFGLVRKIAGLSFFERLFSLWHMVHMPIFFMLIASALIHVYAVHVY